VDKFLFTVGCSPEEMLSVCYEIGRNTCPKIFVEVAGSPEGMPTTYNPTGQNPRPKSDDFIFFQPFITINALEKHFSFEGITSCGIFFEVN